MASEPQHTAYASRSGSTHTSTPVPCDPRPQHWPPAAPAVVPTDSQARWEPLKQQSRTRSVQQSRSARPPAAVLQRTFRRARRACLRTRDARTDEIATRAFVRSLRPAALAACQTSARGAPRLPAPVSLSVACSARRSARRASSSGDLDADTHADAVRDRRDRCDRPSAALRPAQASASMVVDRPGASARARVLRARSSPDGGPRGAATEDLAPARSATRAAAAAQADAAAHPLRAGG